jgi:hypothetical protein
MSNIRRLNASQPIVNPNGVMEFTFQQWALLVSDMMPLTGAGSPEGVVEAQQYAKYLNTSGGAGTIEYRKMLPDIGGDTKQGWVLV